MLANPVDAIFRCETLDELAFVMEEAFVGVMKRKDGGDYTLQDWAVWACKYPNFYVARKCAVAMYCRIIVDRRIPHV